MPNFSTTSFPTCTAVSYLSFPEILVTLYPRFFNLDSTSFEIVDSPPTIKIFLAFNLFISPKVLLSILVFSLKSIGLFSEVARGVEVNESTSSFPDASTMLSEFL